MNNSLLKIEINEGFPITELGILPEDWKIDFLKKTVESIDYGHSISIPKNENKNGINIISTADITKDGNILYNQIRKINPPKKLVERLILKNGDILFNWRNSPELIGKSALFEKRDNDEAYIYASFILRIRHKKGVSHNNYLQFLLNFYREKGIFFKLARRAVNQANYNKNEISLLKVPLPPLPEQKKIAAVLSIIQEAKEKTEAVIEAAKKLKKSLMKYLFTYGPVPVEEAENVRLKETEIGLMPEDWKQAKLNAVCCKIQDGSHFSPKIQYRTPCKGRYLYITSKNIKENGINLSDVTYVDYCFHKTIYNRCNPEKGDVLLIKDGVMTGIAAINTLDEEFSLLSSVVLLKPKKNNLNSYYLKYFLTSPGGFCTITGEMTGSAIKRIILEKIRNANIFYPSLYDQEKIAEILFAVDQKIKTEENNKKALEELFKTLLQNLMTGKIRVNNLEIPV